jgi:hypothetical protein
VYWVLCMGAPCGFSLAVLCGFAGALQARAHRTCSRARGWACGRCGHLWPYEATSASDRARPFFTPGYVREFVLRAPRDFRCATWRCSCAAAWSRRAVHWRATVYDQWCGPCPWRLRSCPEQAVARVPVAGCTCKTSGGCWAKRQRSCGAWSRRVTRARAHATRAMTVTPFGGRTNGYPLGKLCGLFSRQVRHLGRGAVQCPRLAPVHPTLPVRPTLRRLCGAGRPRRFAVAGAPCWCWPLPCRVRHNPWSRWGHTPLAVYWPGAEHAACGTTRKLAL